MVEPENYSIHKITKQAKSDAVGLAVVLGAVFAFFFGAMLIAYLRGDEMAWWIYAIVAVFGIVLLSPIIHAYFALTNQIYLALNDEHMIFNAGGIKARVAWENVASVEKRKFDKDRYRMGIALYTPVAWEGKGLWWLVAKILSLVNMLDFIVISTFEESVDDSYDPEQFANTPLGHDIARYVPHLLAAALRQ